MRLGFWTSVAFAYLLPATLFFGNPFVPPLILVFSHDHLGAPYWRIVSAMGLVVGVLAALFATHLKVSCKWSIPIFVFISMSSATVIVATYAELLRSEVSEEFAPDKEIRASFFRSLREAPKGTGFWLHGVALKECVPYLWSYRAMSFHRLSPNIAFNVMPYEWVEECQIERDR